MALLAFPEAEPAMAAPTGGPVPGPKESNRD
jgi:hypothetical protein